MFNTLGLGEGHKWGYFGAFIIGGIMSAYVMYGFDTAGTLAEETNDPRRNAPPAIIKALATASVIGGVMILVRADGGRRHPRQEHRAAAACPTSSSRRWASTVGNIFLIDSAIAITVCCLAVHTSCIRMMFAMARDGRLPFGPQVARVSGRGKVPIVPAIVVGFCAIVLLAINIGNQSAFLALTSVAIIMFYLAYLCVTGPLLLRRLRGTWPTPEHGTYFSLGRWGVLVNVFAVVYGAIVAFNIAWPRTDVYNAIGPHHWYFQWAAYLFIGGVMLIGGDLLLHRLQPHADRGPRRAQRDDRGPAVAGDRRRGAMIAEGEFDYVIAGGGTAGCVVAARLSEDPDVSVCLLEAGPSDVDDAAILRLEDWMYLLDSGYDWDYLVEPQEKGNSFLRHARAKVLGGCSSHNSCIAFWTPREDLDEWAAMGCDGLDARTSAGRSSSAWRPTTRRATTTAAAARSTSAPSRRRTPAASPSSRRPPRPACRRRSSTRATR